MTLAELREMPTTIGTGPNGPRIHESCFRSYQLLQKIRGILLSEEHTSERLLIEIIDDVMDAPSVCKEVAQ